MWRLAVGSAWHRAIPRSVVTAGAALSVCLHLLLLSTELFLLISIVSYSQIRQSDMRNLRQTMLGMIVAFVTQTIGHVAVGSMQAHFYRGCPDPRTCSCSWSQASAPAFDDE